MRPANVARFLFLSPRAREFFPDWEGVANDLVANLRTEAGRNPHDRALQDLVGELSTRSQEFRSRWAAHNVRQHQTGRKRLHHPVVGDLELTYEVLALPADPGLSLVVYGAEPGSASQDGLKLLASWAATLDQSAAVQARGSMIGSASCARQPNAMTSPAQSVQREAVSPLELFFDLVFVFAVSQLSHHLLDHLSWRGAAETLVLLIAVFGIWSGTSFEATLLHITRSHARWLLLAVMLAGLFMNAAIADAFETGGWAFVIPLLVIQAGRSILMVVVAPTRMLREHYACCAGSSPRPAVDRGRDQRR